jgi:hypothetical protein
VTTIGVLGRPWRADVDRSGAITFRDGAPALEWFIAADDRWHVPAVEVAVRQRRRSGTPVVETRVRIPGGDAVQRVWAVADGGGLVVVEIENDSPMAMAVAFSRGDLRTSRRITEVPIGGIELPPGAVALPVGHRASVTVALAMDGPGSGPLPDGLPSAVQVERGWLATAERASRLVLADASIADNVVHARCQLALDGPGDPAGDPAGFVLGVGELVRMGERPEPWVLDVVGAAEVLARRGPAWDSSAALGAAAFVLAAAREGERAVGDALDIRRRLSADVPTPALEGLTGARLVARVEQMLLDGIDGDRVAILPGGWPPGSLGVSLEAYRLPAGPRHRVSYAIRWHGERPALLWEIEGPPGLVLTGGGVDPSWSTSDPRGETLLAAPPPTPLGSGPRKWR